MDILLTIAGIIYVIALIFFFDLCRDIGKIKESIVPKNGASNEIRMFLAYGEKEKAKALMQKHVWDEIHRIASLSLSQKMKRKHYFSLKEKYEPLLISVDSDWPAGNFEEAIK